MQHRRTNRPVIPGWWARRAAHVAIRFYQLTLSAFVGRHCRHLPTCSEFTDEAIQRHGLWNGGWMGLARISRCNPWGTSGFDPVPAAAPPRAHWWVPWRYGRWSWRGLDPARDLENPPPVEKVPPE